VARGSNDTGPGRSRAQPLMEPSKTHGRDIANPPGITREADETRANKPRTLKREDKRQPHGLPNEHAAAADEKETLHPVSAVA